MPSFAPAKTQVKSRQVPGPSPARHTPASPGEACAAQTLTDNAQGKIRLGKGGAASSQGREDHGADLVGHCVAHHLHSVTTVS